MGLPRDTRTMYLTTLPELISFIGIIGETDLGIYFKVEDYKRSVCVANKQRSLLLFLLPASAPRLAPSHICLCANPAGVAVKTGSRLKGTVLLLVEFFWGQPTEGINQDTIKSRVVSFFSQQITANFEKESFWQWGMLRLFCSDPPTRCQPVRKPPSKLPEGVLRLFRLLKKMPMPSPRF